MVVEVVPVIVMMSETEIRQHIEIIKAHFEDITPLLLDLDDRQGWEALGYKSMHQMFQLELKGHLNKSVSQIYRKASEAKIRRKLSQICKKVEAIPAYKLKLLGKLLCQEWQNTREEITSTAPNAKVGKEHVKKVVSRIQAQKQVANAVLLRLGDWVELHLNQANEGWDGLSRLIIELEDNNGCFGVDLRQASSKPEWECIRLRAQNLIKVPAPLPYKVEGLVVIDIDRWKAFSSQEKKWNGFWDLVTQIGKTGSLTIDLGRKSLQLFPRELKPIYAPSSSLRKVVERVLRWLHRLELDEIEQLDYLDFMEKFYLSKNLHTLDKRQVPQCRSP